MKPELRTALAEKGRCDLPGVLRELLSSDSEEFGGSGVHNAPEIRSENVPFGTLPCSARVTLPELAAVYFTFTTR